MSDKEDASGIGSLDMLAPDGWRKKVATVLMQMGLSSQRAANMYSAGREALDDIEGRSIVNRALADAVAKQAVADPDVIERAKARFLGRIFAEQENVEAVLLSAEKQMLSLPPPKNADATPDRGNSCEAPVEIDTDWAAAFTREAEKATSHELRERLASILTEEVRKPGSYPRAVFRTLVELESNEILTIKEALPCKFLNALFLDMLPSTEQDRIYKILCAAGLIDINIISQAGLSLNPNPQGGYIIVIPHGDARLIIQGKNPQILGKNTQILTRAGVAAFEIVEDKCSLEILRRFGNAVARDGLRIILGTITTEDGQISQINNAEILHDAYRSE